MRSASRIFRLGSIQAEPFRDIPGSVRVADLVVSSMVLQPSSSFQATPNLKETPTTSLKPVISRVALAPTLSAGFRMRSRSTQTGTQSTAVAHLYSVASRRVASQDFVIPALALSPNSTVREAEAPIQASNQFRSPHQSKSHPRCPETVKLGVIFNPALMVTPPPSLYDGPHSRGPGDHVYSNVFDQSVSGGVVFCPPSEAEP